MNHKSPRRLVFAALAALGSLVACKGAPRIHVSSQPETARVYVNGTFVGNTPADITLPFGEGERVYLQVAHPDGDLVGQQIFTKRSLPVTGEVNFVLR